MTVQHKLYTRDVVVEDDLDDTAWTLTIKFRRPTLDEGVHLSERSTVREVRDNLLKPCVREILDDRTDPPTIRELGTLIAPEIEAISATMSGNSQTASTNQ